MHKMKRPKINSLLALIIAALMLSTLSGTQFVTKVAAAAYTESVGTLDGAQYVVRFPDPWNGMLVVVCRGYSHAPVPDARNYSLYPTVANALLSQGYAVAASTFGAGGYCIQKGMNATYQLTKYLIDTYHVAGKVFLIGASMGGGIALLLGEKYPNVYSGVLDLCGAKDSKISYETRLRWANLSDADLTAELTTLTAPVPPYLFSNLTQLRSFCAVNAADIELETGGSPANKLKAYEDISPTYHANISMPVITVQGTSDALMPLSQTLMYQDAVAKAGRSSLYRLYTIAGGQHVDASITAEIPGRFAELIRWSSIISEGWTLINDARSVKAYPDLREYVWQKNASLAPNGPYDKIGLHRLIKTGITPKGVVFILPGLYGSGERLVSNPPGSNFTKTENISNCLYWANRGFDVYTIDFRNHFIPVNFNKSQLSFTADWGIEQFMSDIKEAVDKAKEVSGTQKVFMAGMSWGGILAQIYAAKYWQQDLRGLILLDPGPPKSTITKNQNLTNSYNLTTTVDTMKTLGNWLWENPQTSTTPSTLNPGYVFLVQFAAQNPGAPAQYLNGTLITTINPRTNKTWTNITEWFEYSWNIANSFNTYGGYSNITINMNLAIQAERYYPVRMFIDYNAMLDWTVCPYLPYDYVAHIREINVPVLAFRSGLNLAAFGNITDGIATTDFTWTVLPNYGHSDVFQGTYSARDVSEPAYEWMISHYPPLTAAATPTTLTVETGQTATFNVYASGTVPPYTYQWYQETNLLIGQTKPQLSMLTTKYNEGSQSTYYCKITDAENQTTNSNIVTLAVKAPQPTPTTAPTVNPTPTPTPTPLPTITPTITPTPNPITPSPTQDNLLLNLPPAVTIGLAIAVVAITIGAFILMILRKRR